MPLVKSVAALGVFGVQLFFFVSALTMCFMWDHRSGEAYPIVKFYIRRFFRIAPPFWLALIGYLLLNGTRPSYWAPNGIGSLQILTSLTFLHGFWPDTINSVVPGGWSIAVEMTFYAFFPLLISCISKDLGFVSWAFFLYALNLFIIHPVYDIFLSEYAQRYPDLVAEFYYFEFFNQAPIFLLGIFLYKWLNRSVDGLRLTIAAFILFSWLVLAFWLKFTWSVSASPFFWLAADVLLVFAFTACTFQLSWAPINRLGQLSYSIYLIHFAVIRFVEWCADQGSLEKEGPLAFLLALVAVLVISWALGVILARTVENASSQLGRRLIGELLMRSKAKQQIAT
jgi:peptidoglycan/LPS O-acetylase OafA/YrhL